MMNSESKVGNLIDVLLQRSAEQTNQARHDYTDSAIQELEKIRLWKPYWIINVEVDGEAGPSRLGNLLGGYPYTSEAYTWPVNDCGQPYLPLIQIDLNEVSHVTGENFGGGLLQVWLDVQDLDLPSVVRVIDKEDLVEPITPPAFDFSVFDGMDSWDQVCAKFSFSPGGVVSPDFSAYLIESDVGRDLSEEEVEVIDSIAAVCESNGVANLDCDWLLGFPDKGSGAPASRYDPVPENFFQFKTPMTFSMANVSRYGNIFYERDDEGVNFLFDWNG